MNKKDTHKSYMHYGDMVSVFSTSEDLHITEINHFVVKRNPAAYAEKSQDEKALLKTRMYAFPNKHGSPVGFNE